MKKTSFFSQENLSWPVLFGLIAGFFELTTYVASPFLFFLSSFSTLFLYVSSLRYGWHLGAISAGVGYLLSSSIFLIKPELFTETLPLLKGLGFGAFKFILPVIISSVVLKKPLPRTLDKVTAIYGYMSLLLLVILVFFYQISIGVEYILSNISGLQNEVLQLGKGASKEKILEAYVQILQLIPGLSIFEFTKNQAFQFLIVFYYFYIRSNIVDMQKTFGFLKLDNIWLYIAIVSIAGVLFSPSLFWGYMSFNIFIVILPLFLFNGFDVFYQRLCKKGMKKSVIALILLFSYIFGWPLLIILCIGLVDKFYSLRLLNRQ